MNNESSPISRILLNLGHAMDHMFLLIFATAVTSISRDFGISRGEDLMPYSAIAFFCFGLGSLPSGRLGDLWGRRKMMIVFFIKILIRLIEILNRVFLVYDLNDFNQQKNEQKINRK